MPTIEYIRRGKHSGSVLAAVLLLGLAAVGLSLLCLTLANVMFGEVGALSDAIGRENAAREAMELSYSYFISETRRRVRHGGYLDSPAENPSPVKEIPQTVFAPVERDKADVLIEGVIIDLHYAASFANEARRLEIPEGRPSLITVSGDAPGSGAKSFYASRYEIRTKVTFNRSPDRAYTMRQGLLTLIDTGDKSLKTVRLYMEK